LGEPIVLGFGILFVIGTVLVALGAYRRALNFIFLGSAILLAIGGAWTLGILGAAIGLLPLLFLKRRHTGFSIPGAPAPFDEQGKFLQIYRKQSDGSWKMTREIYNSDLPLPLPVPAPPPKK
jgi:hypothetical protein